MSDQPTTRNRGNFAEDRDKAARAGRLGGQRSSGNFAHDRARAVEAGRKGGEHSHGGGGARHNPGNFAQDRDKAVEAGRRGGQHSHANDSPESVEQRSQHAELPGQRDSLPSGALRGMPPGPQGDENRDPPPQAPSVPE